MRLNVTAALVLAALMVSLPVRAQEGLDKKLQDEIQKEFQQAGQGLIQKITALVQKNVKGALEENSRKIAELEKQLDEARKKLSSEVAGRDQKIASLTAKIQELEKALAARAAAPASKPGFAGVAVSEIEPELRQQLKLGGDIGARVAAIVPGAPAQKAGLQEGDIIVQVNGKDVSGKNLAGEIRKHAPGSKVQITYYRGDEKKSANLELLDRAAFQEGIQKVVQEKASPPPAPPAPQGKAVLGLLIEEKDRGLEVQNVEKDLTGQVAGVQNGDVLQEFNGKAIRTLEDLRGALAGLKAGDSISMKLRRGDSVVVTRVVAGGEKGGARHLGTDIAKVETPATPEKAKPEDAAPPAPRPGFLGLTVEEQTEAVKVASVREGAAAAAYGLQPGDIVKKIGDVPVTVIDDIKKGLAGKMAGDAVVITVVRGDKTLTISGIRLGARGEKVAAPEKIDVKVVEPAKKREKGHLGILANETDSAVVVVQVAEGGPAARAKVQKDDRILEINGQAVKNFEDMIRALEGTFAGDRVRVVVQRGDQKENLEITLEKKD